MLLVAFTLFRPGFWWDMIYPPLEQLDGAQISEVIEDLPEDHELRIRVTGMDMYGNDVDTIRVLPLGAMADSGEERLANLGLANSTPEEGGLLINSVQFGSAARDIGLDFGWRIEYIEVETERPPREIMWIPAVLLIALVAFLQVRRRRLQGEIPPPAASKQASAAQGE